MFEIKNVARMGLKMAAVLGICLALGGCIGGTEPDTLDVSILATNAQAPSWAYGAAPQKNCTGGYGCGNYQNRNQSPAGLLDAENVQTLNTAQAAIQEGRTARRPEQNSAEARLQRAKELARQVLVMRGLQREGCPSGRFFGQPGYDVLDDLSVILYYRCQQADGHFKMVTLPVDDDRLLKSDPDLSHNQLLKMEQELERQQQTASAAP